MCNIQHLFVLLLRMRKRAKNLILMMKRRKKTRRKRRRKKQKNQTEEEKRESEKTMRTMMRMTDTRCHRRQQATYMVSSLCIELSMMLERSFLLQAFGNVLVHDR